MTTYRHTFPEPIPAGFPVRFLTDAGWNAIVGIEWEVPEVRTIEIRQRSPEEVRERLLSSPLPPGLASALADEVAPEG